MTLKHAWPVSLRDVRPRDLPLLFKFHSDKESNRLGGFIPRNKRDFFAHWKKVLADKSNLKMAILLDGEVAGYLVCFVRVAPKREVGYWVARKHWGKGLATTALDLFLKAYAPRPLYARVSKTNAGSLKVVQRCGFRAIGEDKYSNAAGTEIEEYILKLRGRGGLRA
ncbi:MAG: GNAT family N-acetyltransferase [Elusimicrobiota bacterium]